MSDSKQLTWRDLKVFADNLDPNFLDNPVIWWGEERGGTIKSVDQLEERYYYDDVCYSPESTFDTNQPLDEQIPDLEDFKEKGTPILYVD